MLYFAVFAGTKLDLLFLNLLHFCRLPVQALSFQAMARSSSERPTDNPFGITCFRTAFRVTEGVPLPACRTFKPGTFQRVSDLSLFLSHSCALFGTVKNSTLFFSIDSALFARKHPGWGCHPSISPVQLFQLQSPGSVWQAANPHALWAQEQNGSSEVRE